MSKTKMSDAVDVVSIPEYEENLSVRVKGKTDQENPELHHYFGPLLRDKISIDELHKYCALCLQSHTMKRYVIIVNLVS